MPARQSYIAKLTWQYSFIIFDTAFNASGM